MSVYRKYFLDGKQIDRSVYEWIQRFRSLGITNIRVSHDFPKYIYVDKIPTLLTDYIEFPDLFIAMNTCFKKGWENFIIVGKNIVTDKDGHVRIGTIKKQLGKEHFFVDYAIAIQCCVCSYASIHPESMELPKCPKCNCTNSCL
jgi:hypothetical protein